MLRAINKIKWKDDFYKSKFNNIILLITFLGILAYSNAIYHPFVHDDIIFIKNNPNISDISNLSSLFFKTTQPAGYPAINPYYWPLLEFLNRILYQIFHFNSYGYHFLNVIIHIINSVLVFHLLKALTSRLGLSLCVSLVFMLHPIQSQTVASIAGKSNLIYALFCLLSLEFYLRAFKKMSGKIDRKLFYFSLILFIFALFVKEQAIILPFLIILIEVLFAFKGKLKNFKMTHYMLSYFVISSVYFLFRGIISKQNIIYSLFLYHNETWLRIISIPKTILMYFGILLFPKDLHYFRSVDILEPIGFSFLFLLAIFAIAIWLILHMRKEVMHLLIFGAGWFLICLLPVINIFPVIIEYSIISTAEHFLYLPMIGFTLFIFVVMDQYLRPFHQFKGKIVMVFMVPLSLCFLVLTMYQNRFWRGEIPLFERSIKYEKNIGRLHILLGRAYYFNRQFDLAIQSYSNGLKVMKGYAQKSGSKVANNFYFIYIKEAYFDMAHCYEAKGNFAQSIVYYKKAIIIDPHDGYLYNNLGTAYLNVGNVDEAVKNFIKAINLNPKDVMAMNNLAICLIEKNNFLDAKKILMRALEIEPNFVSASQNLKKLMQEQNHEK